MLRTYINSQTKQALEVTATQAPLDFHRRLPGYQASPLVSADSLALELGIGKLWIKDESLRFGLPAYKVLGGSWATYKALEQKLGGFKPWQTLGDLSEQLAPLRPLTLVAPTDGNHGRGVARMAKLLGLGAHIYFPDNTSPARTKAVAEEGANITVVKGTYDDTLAHTLSELNDSRLLISDFAFAGYEEIPRWVLEGYSTIFWEIDDELSRLGEAAPDVIFVQVGCGAFAAAVVQHYRRSDFSNPAKIVSVEPTLAPCVIASMEAGRMVTLTEPQDSIMQGLNCGTPSLVAWPLMQAGIDVFMAVEDKDAEVAMRQLAKIKLVSGESGVAGLAGLSALLKSSQASYWREQLNLTPSSRVLLFSTEGATDPVTYQNIVGQPSAENAMMVG
jgi:diaminopropionate ammonia-lyase